MNISTRVIVATLLALIIKFSLGDVVRGWITPTPGWQLFLHDNADDILSVVAFLVAYKWLPKSL